MQQLYAVDPVKDCPHCTELDFTKFEPKCFNHKCEDCDNVGENWICLECQIIFCSRYVNEHMVKHNEVTNHPVALSFSDLSFWCYACDTYVKSTRFDKVHDHFYKQKFGDTSKDDVLGIISKMTDMDINKEKEEDKTETNEETKDTKSDPSASTSQDGKEAIKSDATEQPTSESTEEEKKEEEKKFTREELIENIKSGKYKKVTVLTGAGISVSAGIPDFRSPKIGLYATLKEKYDMDDPTEIFSLETFLKSPELFYDFAKEFDWDKYDPTPTHYFIGFLHKKKMLDLNFTQNIDCLEEKAGIPHTKIMASHGNLSGAHCPKCQKNKSLVIFKEHVKKGEIFYCDKCEDVPVKPKVVFFGEALPVEVLSSATKIPEADLGIVVGTSLAVSPFNAFPTMFNKDANMVTINMEPISHIGRLNDPKSLFLEGKCDEVITELIKDLGWTEEFDEFVRVIQEKEAKIKSENA